MGLSFNGEDGFLIKIRQKFDSFQAHKDMKIYIATKNPNKIKIVEEVFKNNFHDTNIEVETSDVESGVVGTPSDNDNYIGAKNRAVNSQKKYMTGDYFVGLETGLIQKEGTYFEETWCVIVNKLGQSGVSYSSGNFIDHDIKTRKITTEESSLLEVYDDINNVWNQYSGKLDFRTLEIKNSVECSLKLLMDKEDK